MIFDDLFNQHLSTVITLVSCKSNRYKYTLKQSNIHCTVYKTQNKRSIEFPVTSLDNPLKQKAELNEYFYNYIRSKLISNFTALKPIINSINYKLMLELNDNNEIIDIYYKVAFFSKSKNIVIRIFPNEEATTNFRNNQNTISIHQAKHKIIHSLFGIVLDEDFIFDQEGIVLIQMLSI